MHRNKLMDYSNTALRPPVCDLRALEHGKMKGIACTPHAREQSTVWSARTAAYVVTRIADDVAE